MPTTKADIIREFAKNDNGTVDCLTIQDETQKLYSEEEILNAIDKLEDKDGYYTTGYIVAKDLKKELGLKW